MNRWIASVVFICMLSVLLLGCSPFEIFLGNDGILRINGDQFSYYDMGILQNYETTFWASGSLYASAKFDDFSLNGRFKLWDDKTKDCKVDIKRIGLNKTYYIFEDIQTSLFLLSTIDLRQEAIKE